MDGERAPATPLEATAEAAETLTPHANAVSSPTCLRRRFRLRGARRGNVPGKRDARLRASRGGSWSRSTVALATTFSTP